MTDEPEKVDLETPDLAAEQRARLDGFLRDLVPGALDDGVLDLGRLGELLDVPVTQVPDGRERYGLQWAGKHAAVRSLLTASRGSLTPVRRDSISFDDARNVFIEGDNLEVLKLLQKPYNDRVKLIYIDPPYNTGNDFVYNDDFSDGLRGYLKYTGQVDEDGNRLSTNAETGGRRHSRWLSMIYPRLVLARNLLTQDGVIMISIDENEATNLRLVLDEVFGAENFIAQLTVLCNPKGRSQDKYFATNHEYVLVYSRTVKEAGSFTVEKESTQVESDYPLRDAGGPYRLLELRNTHREFGRHNRPNLYYPLFVQPDGTVSLEGDGDEVLPLWPDGFEGCWTWGHEKASNDVLLLVGRKANGNLKIYRKDYAKGARRMLKTILSDNRYTTESGQRAFNEILGVSGKLFQSPKSPHLLMDLIATSTTGDDLILDFFAGSGSTAHAVALLNAFDGGSRRTISVNLPEQVGLASDAAKAGYQTVSQITMRRLYAVSEQVEGAAKLGLRSFVLEQSNFRQTAGIEGELDLSESTLAGDEPDWQAIATEVLLKEGVPLDQSWERHDLDGVSVVVAAGVAVVLSDRVDDALVSGALQLPVRVAVFLEDGFAGADAVKANAVASAKSLGVTMKTI